MANFNDLRAAALALPGAYENLHMGGPAFRVNGKKFALFWAAGGRTIMKLDPAHQLLLFETRPELFAPVQVGTRHWSFVELAGLDVAEVQALTREAWSTVAPKTARRAVAA